MRIICFFFIITFLNYCNEKLSSNNHPELKKALSKQDSIKHTIIGKWGGLEAKHPSFEIMWDSINLFGRSITCPYQLVNNDMIIVIPEGKIVFGDVHVVNDTIFFIDETGNIKGFRFKNR